MIELNGYLSECCNPITGSISSSGSLKPRYIIVGDSYGEGYSADGHYAEYPLRMANMLGWSSDQWKNVSKGGSGFASGTRWETLLRDAASQMTDEFKMTTKLVLVCGGFNDREKTYQEIVSAIQSFVNYVKTTFPYATIVVAPIGWCIEGKTQTGVTGATYINLTNVATTYQSEIVKRGGGCVPLSYGILRSRSLFSSDGFHPNDAGQQRIAECLVNWMVTGGFDLAAWGSYGTLSKETFEPNDKVSGIRSLEGRIYVLGETSMIAINQFSIDLKDVQYGFTGDTFEIGTIHDPALYGCHATLMIPFSGVIDLGDKLFTDVSGCLFIYNGKISLSIKMINSAGTAYENAKIKWISINPTSHVYSTLRQ